ncbi:hypothetical protein [uncultured Draconibacterium sp.]|uniref:hypothetical protein n=1 Tax=uncultured Draconibacterium sp. TaxID=1573823 RepID=UPI0025DE4220|nr:hypothetical protein [uncultured Draconibacterium sp.]
MKTTEQQDKKKFLVTTIGVIIMLILMATSTVIFAQPPGGNGGGQQGPPPIPNSKQIKKMVAELAADIQLNEDQQTQVLAIYQEHFAAVEKATGSGRPDRSKMEALKASMEKKVTAVLSDEQQELFAAYLKKQQKKQGRSRP